LGVIGGFFSAERNLGPALKIGFKNFDMNWGLTDEFPEMWRK